MARTPKALAGHRLSAAALAPVLAFKAQLEERWMLALHADYAADRVRSWRLLPGLF